ncbi:MAG: hypothetical protein K2Q01_08795, partial [Rickettsiales bacterium]|nr:hypothetical protein [Rickettsiales bacterium]
MHKVVHALTKLNAALAAWFIFLFVYVAFWSIAYPFQLEWIEGQSMDMVRRVALAKPLYVEPSLEYVALLYTPFFYYISAAFSVFTGMNFAAGRLVSLLSILAVAAIFFQWSRREGGTKQQSLIAVGLLFSTYVLSGRWF